MITDSLVSARARVSPSVLTMAAAPLLLVAAEVLSPVDTSGDQPAERVARGLH